MAAVAVDLDMGADMVAEEVTVVVVGMAAVVGMVVVAGMVDRRREVMGMEVGTVVAAVVMEDRRKEEGMEVEVDNHKDLVGMEEEVGAV